MADNVNSGTFEQRFRRLASYIQSLPLVFWRNLVIVFALLWLCRSLASLFWLVMPSPDLPVPTKLISVNGAGSANAVAYSVDLAALQAKDIFGDAVVDLEEVQAEEQGEQARPGIEDEAVKTKLDLKLVGVLVSNNPDYSAATISRGSDQQIYQIDDKLPAGNAVTLAKVLADRVILDNNGNYEALWLYSEADFNVSSGRSFDRSVTRRPSPQRQDEDEEDEAEAEDGDENVVESKIKAADIPKSISDVVRFSVHREDGQMVGFRIRPGKNRELFDQLGLKTNDVVTAVNGIPIDNAQAIRDNYQELKSATSADLEVKRDEEVVYINVSLDTGG